jgi:hypothetical protein
VTCDSTDSETIRFTNRLSEALGDAGINAIRGPDSVSEEDEFGIVVRVDDIDNPSPFGRSLIEFFKLSGLDFTVRKSPRRANPGISIMVAPQMVPSKEGAGS